MTEEKAPAAYEPRIPRAVCTKILRAIFGPKAYMQTMRENGKEAGLRVITFPNGVDAVEVARATLKPGQQPSAEDKAKISFALLTMAAKAVNFSVQVAKDTKGRVTVEAHRMPTPKGMRRLSKAQEADVCEALMALGLDLEGPACQGCDRCDAADETPCFAWGEEAFARVKAFDATPEGKARLQVPEKSDPCATCPGKPAPGDGCACPMKIAT